MSVAPAAGGAAAGGAADGAVAADDKKKGKKDKKEKPPKEAKEVVFVMKFDFKAKARDELTVRKGASVVGFDQPDEGGWIVVTAGKGTVNTKTGKVPYSYVKKQGHYK